MILLLMILSAMASASGKNYPYMACFEVASRAHDIDLDLLLAVAAVESNWNATARSAANAHGIMQIRWPQTARHLGSRRVAELYNPCLNIDLGARYMHELSQRYNGDVQLMLAAYNYGPTRIQTIEDVPTGVNAYVEKVSRRRSEISRSLRASNPAHASDRMELSRFHSLSRAQHYMKSFERLVPDIELSIEHRRNQNIIYLDSRNLSAQALYRIGVLIPEFGNGDNNQ
jgi:soluble lytic murein transglycosylase-like protein